MYMDEKKIKVVRFKQPVNAYAGVENFDSFVEEKFQEFIKEGYKFEHIKVDTFVDGDKYVAVFILYKD